MSLFTLRVLFVCPGWNFVVAARRSSSASSLGQTLGPGAGAVLGAVGSGFVLGLCLGQGALGLILFKTLRPVATRIPTSALSPAVVMEFGRCSSGRACCGAALRKASMQPEKGPFKEYSSLVVCRGLFFRVHAVCRSANNQILC